MTGMRGVVALLALAAAGLTAAPARSADALVLTGSTSGWVEVRVPGESAADLSRVDVSTKGRFGGFLAEQVTTVGNHAHYQGRLTGHLLLRGLTAEPIHLGDVPSVAPGLVRFYLIADGPTTVTISPMGGPTFLKGTYRPARRTTASVTAAPMTRADGAWSRVESVLLRKRAFALTAVVAEGTLPAAAQAESCFTKTATCTDPVTRLPVLDGRSTDGDAQVGYLSEHYAWDTQQHVPAGRYAVRYAVSSPLEIRRARALRFALTLA